MAGAQKSGEDTISDINIVPLVDIILVVLIIFMVTAPSDKAQKIEVNLPEAASGEPSTGNEPFQVSLNEDGYLFVSGEAVTENELLSRAEVEMKKNNNLEAILTADKNLDYGQVVKVIDLIKSVGVQKISISTTSQLEN